MEELQAKLLAGHDNERRRLQQELRAAEQANAQLCKQHEQGVYA